MGWADVETRSTAMIARETIENKRENINGAPKSALDEKEEIKYHFLSEIERRKKLVQELHGRNGNEI